MPNQYTPHQRQCVLCNTDFLCKPSSKRRFCSLACWHKTITGDNAAKLWNHVDKTGDCWLWTGKAIRHGYGAITTRGKSIGVHRLSYELAYGPIPPGMCVCHKCDVRACVRPDHLFLGTLQDNHDDMVRKGRHVLGPKVRQARLRPDDIPAIRAAYKTQRFSHADLARQYRVSTSTIQRVVARESWKHI
jgi:hypothetical protein